MQFDDFFQKKLRQRALDLTAPASWAEELQRGGVGDGESAGNWSTLNSSLFRIREGQASGNHEGMTSMGKLIQWNVLSLDGYFEGERSWDVEWFHSYFESEQREFSLQQLRSAAGLVFGRVTYEGMAAYWRTATDEVAGYMNSLPKYVVSNTLMSADWEGTTILAGDPVGAVRKLKERAIRDLFVFGSGKLSATLLEGGLFDEVRLGLVPIVIGAGTTLFGRGLPRTRMKLLEARPLNNGFMILRYEPPRA